jgi:hypothetical protein
MILESFLFFIGGRGQLIAIFLDDRDLDYSVYKFDSIEDSWNYLESHPSLKAAEGFVASYPGDFHSPNGWVNSNHE